MEHMRGAKTKIQFQSVPNSKRIQITLEVWQMVRSDSSSDLASLSIQRVALVLLLQCTHNIGVFSKKKWESFQVQILHGRFLIKRESFRAQILLVLYWG